MTCVHCAYSCTDKGEDMSIETLKNCFKYGDECIAIGGGEPTIHPLFWQVLGLCMAESEHVWLATNGKETSTAIALAMLAKKGVIGCDLSQDEYHEYIDPKVIEAYLGKEEDEIA